MINTETVIALGAALLLAGCAAPRMAPDAQGVSFPVREASYRQRGIVVLPEAIRQLQPGLDKDQVRQLLGNPHFTEGLFFVRDWNYLVELDGSQGDRLDCQLQLQFDAAGRVTATHWQTETCAAAAGVAGSATAPASAEASRTPADGVPAAATAEERLPRQEWRFPFARSSLEDLTDMDLTRLEVFAAEVGARASEVQEITIEGHSDRIGSPDRRERRSLARARAVADAFIHRGIDPQQIVIVGHGADAPVSECPSALPYHQLLDCLAPDRRVVIAVRLSRHQTGRTSPVPGSP